jgi:two-component system response regulator GlrR
MDQRPNTAFLLRSGIDASAGPSASVRRQPDATVAKPATSAILIVEDQEDVRRMLATALLMEGHQVDEAANAAEGLERLTCGRYRLVLSDYAMPGGTGSWMLREATRLGLLDETAAVIITAHPDIEPVPGIVVINKPLDLDDFLDQLRRLLDTVAERERLTREMPRPYRVELVLYVSAASAASRLAQEAVEGVLQDFDASQVRYRVYDLVREPLAGAADRVTLTPTLVRRFPKPQVWLLGSMRDPMIVSDLLRAGGVDPRNPDPALPRSG